MLTVTITNTIQSKVRNGGGGGGFDPDAQAFFTATGLTGATELNAINNLVVALKGFGIWTKMKAIYPMIGGTAALHKWNLKDPRDLDAAFRLNFVGGWTHSASGALPNGTNGYANTYLDSANNLSLNSGHMSFYSRTNLVSAAINIDMGSLKSSPDSYTDLDLSNQSNTYFRFNNGGAYNFISSTTTLGFFTGSRTASNVIKTYRNGAVIISGTAASSATSSTDYFIGASNNHGVGTTDTPQYYSNRECAFASIGDGLSDIEAANFYTAVQAFQVALGRSIGTQTVSDADAQAFVNAAVIEDQIQATAINQLVTDMKGYGLWNKMKAVYPFIGGTAASHKWNLKNPLDTNAAFRLVFTGGWTHSSTGAKPNGTNAYADTFFNPSVNSIQNSHHFSVYLRNNEANKIPFGCTTSNTTLYGSTLIPRLSGSTNYGINQTPYSAPFADSDSRSHYIVTRTASNVSKAFKRNVLQSTSTIGSVLANASYYIGHWNSPGITTYFSTNENAFTSIGDGLTDTEAANLYLAVQNFNTTLSRQV